MNKMKLITTLIVVVSLILFLYWFKGYLKIDKCLDSGGRWNYDKGICEYK